MTSEEKVPPEPGAGDRGSRLRRPTASRPHQRRWPRWLALGTACAVLAVTGLGWLGYRKLNGNITTDLTAAEELARYDAERPPPAPGRARNILVIGSDSPGDDDAAGLGRDDDAAGEGDDGVQRSDTVILLHLAGDRESATALSIPRDLLVEIPDCTGPDGRPVGPRSGQFNAAFGLGGAACTIRTLERLTGIRVDHHLVIDFTGFRRLVDAVGGVEVCLQRPVRDRLAGLDLPAGRQLLKGEDALAFVRARKELGDGSDTSRIARQQHFLGSLVRKLHSSGVLLNPTRLYPVLDTATSALTVDAGLDSLTKIYDLIREVREVPGDRMLFVTVPRESAPADPDRDVLVQPTADRLFQRLREDLPVEAADAWPTADPATAERNDAPPKDETTGRDICP